MRIAFVIDRFDAGRGGGEGYAVSLARLLVKRGHEVHVFAKACTDDVEGVRFHELTFIPYPRWVKVLTLARSARRTRNSMPFDVVQGFGGVPGVDVHRPGGGAELAWLIQEIRSREKRFDRIATASTRILSLKLATNLLMEQALYGPSSRPRVIANSLKVKQDILRFYRSVESSRIRIIRNGVDLGRFHPRNRTLFAREIRQRLGLADRSVVILFMAHNFKLKGLHCLIRSLHAAKERAAWVLLVAGRGRRRPFQVLAQRHGIDDRLIFLDHVKHPETVLAACDVLAHPTFYDPFSNVCLEAMASGVPVITTKHNGASEIIQNGVSGYVIPDPRRGDILLRGIEALLDPDQRKRMGGEAREVAERFSWGEHVSRMESLYHEILEERA